MPKLKEKFFNKPDTLTQEKKSLAEAIKSGGMLKSARRKKGVKTDAEKESLIESMMGGGKRRAAKRSGGRGRPKKFKTVEEVKADIDKRNPTYVSPLTGGLLPGEGPKEPKEKKDELKDFLLNVLQPSLTKIEDNLSKILGNFDKQIELEKEKQDDLRVSGDIAGDKAREDKLEKSKGKGMLKTGIEKAVKPVNDFMGQIMNFFKNILLGSVVQGLLQILEDPEKIMKPLRDFANGVIDFGNMLIKGVNRFILGPINFVVQGLLDGLQFILNPIGMLARIFKLGEVDLPLDKFRENIQPVQIPEIPRIEPKAEMQGGGEVPGQGTGDTVPAMLEPGEFVMSKGAVDQIGVDQLEQMNAEGGGTNQPIMRGGTSYAKGGGSIGIKGSGNTGKLAMADSDGKPVGPTYNVISGKPGTGNISQEMRKGVSGEGYPMPDGTYKVHSFEEHGPLSGALKGLGDWSAYIGSGDGNIGKRSGMMIHSDIDPYGTLGCIGVDLGGKPGTQAEKNFLKAWSMTNPEIITVDFGAPTGGAADIGGGTRSETSDNSIAKMSPSQSGSKTTPPPTPNGGGKLAMVGGGDSGGSGGLTSGNGPASQKGARRFSSVDMRDDSNIIVQSIYNLVG
jgi:hypothetical protein